MIASDISGLPEHVVLVPADDKEAWASAIERLEDNAESERLGWGAYESRRESFNPEIAPRSLEQVYDEAIESSAASGRTFSPTSARLMP